MTESPPVNTHWELGFQHMNLGRHKHSVISTMEQFHHHHLYYYLADCPLPPGSSPRVRSAQVLGNQWLLWEDESQVLLSLVVTPTLLQKPCRISCSPHIDKDFCPKAPLCLLLFHVLLPVFFLITLLINPLHTNSHFSICFWGMLHKTVSLLNNKADL